MNVDVVVVRGNATELELAAVLAVMASVTVDPIRPTGYAKWRKQRIHALHGNHR